MAPLLLIVPAWLAGIFIQGWLQLPFWGLACGAVVSGVFLLGYVLYNRRFSDKPERLLSLTLPLCGVAFCFGALRLLSTEPAQQPDQLLYYVDQGEVKLVGVVSDDPVYSERSGTYRLSIREVYAPANAAKPIPVSGDLFVRASAKPQRKAGDLLEIVGKLEEPKEITGDGFPYRDWLARQGIFVSLSYPASTRLLATEQDFFLFGWLRAIRNSSEEIIRKFVPGEEGELLVGMLLGDRDGISPELNKAFRDTGTAHIVAISGSNISIAVMLVSAVLGRFLKRRKVQVIVIFVIIFYVLLVGASPSVVRAGLMGLLVSFGLLFGRDYEGLLGLEASALIMTLFQPRVLYDVGFQLSFLATLGLIIIARPLQEWCYVKDWLPILKEGLIITLAAELMILPLVAFYFHQVSFVSLTANLLAVPALEGIMATGLFALGMGWIFGWWLPVIAQITGYSVSIFLTYLIATVEFFANLPFASATLPAFHPIWIFYYYLLLGLILWLLRDPQKRGRTLLARASSSPLVWGGTASLAVLVWLAVFFL